MPGAGVLAALHGRVLSYGMFDNNQFQKVQLWRGCAGDGGAPGAMFQHLCATLLQQSHLCPLPLEAQAVVWAHDAGLRLYPLPHALVLADPAPSTHCAFEGTVCLNPVRLCA